MFAIVMADLLRALASEVENDRSPLLTALGDVNRRALGTLESPVGLRLIS